MKSYFPDEYYYQKSTSLTVPSDNPGFLNIDRAIAGGTKIFDEHAQALGSTKEKRKILLNLTYGDWVTRRKELSNHCILLFHGGFELYAVKSNSLYPITTIDDDLSKHHVHNVDRISSDEVKKRFCSNTKENEILVFGEQQLQHICEIGYTCPPTCFSIPLNQINAKPPYCFAISLAGGDDIIKYFSESPSISIKIQKLKLICCHFKEGEIEKLFALLPNLEVLFLDSSNLSLITSDLKLSTLKKLSISLPSLSQREVLESLIQLINAAPRLQILQFQFDGGLRLKMPLDNCETNFFQNDTLHTLILNGVQINSAQLSQLLSPSLLILDLDNSNIIGTFEEKKDLPHLTKCSVTGATLFQHLLSDLFAAFSNLKQINLVATKLRQGESEPTPLPHNSLRKLLVSEDFFNYFKVKSDSFPHLEYIFLESGEDKFDFLSGNVDLLIDLLKQFNDKNVSVEAGSQTIIFRSTRSHDGSGRLFSFTKCNQKVIETFINNFSTKGIKLNGIASNSLYEEFIAFFSQLCRAKIPIDLTNIDKIDVIQAENLERINFDFSSKIGFSIQSGQDKCHCSIEHGTLLIFGFGNPMKGTRHAKISTANLAALIKKFPSGINLKINLKLDCVEIIGDFSILPSISVKSLELSCVYLNGPYADQLWSSVRWQMAEVDNIHVSSDTKDHFPLYFKKLRVDQRSWNSYFSKLSFKEMELDLCNYSQDDSNDDKLGLTPHEEVTSFDFRRSNNLSSPKRPMPYEVSEGVLSSILSAFPNLKCLKISKLGIISPAFALSRCNNKIEQLAIESLESFLVKFKVFPVKLFPQLKKLSVLSVQKISARVFLMLPSIFEEIHLRAVDEEGPTKNSITLSVEEFDKPETFSPNCIVYFESPCVIDGDEKQIIDFMDFIDSHPNFKFSEQPLIKDIKPVQTLDSFDPSRLQRITAALNPNSTQTMLVDRLCAYTRFILPKGEADSFNNTLLNGICEVVSKWFADTLSEGGKIAWRQKWNTIRQWDKQTLPEKGTVARSTLDELFEYTKKYQPTHTLWSFLWDSFWESFTKSRVLTNQLDVFLKNPPKKSILISSNWHTTCLSVEANQWQYLDPNLQNGEPLVFNFDETNALVAEIYRVLGHGLLITSEHEKLNEAWSLDQGLIDSFCAEGGFRFLPQYDDDSKKVDIASLSKEALSGIFLLSTYHKPFWFHGLTLTVLNGLIATKFSEITLLFLTHYAKKTHIDELKNKINEGLKYLSRQDREQLALSLEYATETKVITIILSALTADSIPTRVVRYTWLPEISIEEVKATEGANLKAKAKVIFAKSLIASPPASTPTVGNDNILPTSPFKTVHEKNIAKESDESIEKFDHYLLGLYGKNVLLDIQDDSTLINYIHHLQAQPQAKDRGLFVINSPGDMQCAVRSLFLDERGKAIIKPAPSGPFYDFLNTHKTPIVVVNWQHLREGAGQQAYSMVEEIRRIEAIQFPKKALVLVLHHSKTEPALLSNDFIKETFPAHFEVPPVSWPVVQFSEDETVTEVVLELYNDPLWENHFYGYFKLEKEGLFFNDSPLLAALKAKPTALRLVLKNPPQRPDFDYVLNSWLKTGTLTKYNLCFELPIKIGIEDQYGYDLAHLLANDRLQVIEGCLGQEDQYILNPTTLSSFFVNYDIDPDTKGPISLPGFLKLHQAAEMHIAVTQSISLSAWARLLMAAGHLKLRVKLCENVQLPPELAALVPVKPKKALSQALQAQSAIARLIVSDDISATKKILEQEERPDLVVDVSELSKGDLFYALFPAKNSDPEHFLQLDEVTSDIWSALIFRDESLATQTVLLTGSFSLELVDVLATFFKPGGGIYHRGHWKFPFGKLIVLTSELGGFTYVVHPEYRKETFDKKLQLLSEAEASRLLGKYSGLELNELATYPLSFLRSLATCESLPNKPRELLNPYLFSTISKVDEDFSLAYEQYISFKESRKLDFFNGLKKGPSVFISGETGTGKSSFMHELEKEPDLKVFFGDTLSWLETSRGEDNQEIQYAILFIDEANLNNVNYSFVEDLYNNSRNIFYKCCNSLLDPRFKVVFAGNAQNYGGERNLPTLFMNHPNAITFGEMSNAYLFYEALLPILEGVETEETAKEIARIFLRTYQEVKKGDNQAISTRELKQMAYFYRAQKLPDDKVERAKSCAYQIASLVLTSEAQHSFDDWFQGRFGPIQFEQEPVPERMGRYKKGSDHKKKVLLVPSLKPVYHLLRTFIAVRTIRQALTGKASYGGLAGLVLEGENGDKARRFVKEYLLGDGFVKRTIDAGVLRDFNYSEAKASNTVVPSKHFYYLSASLNLRATINLLIRAFHEGAVVIFVNTPQFKLLEPVINPLSMGEDLSGNRALVPGFSLVVISNADAVEDSMSPAVKHRVMPCQFPCESEAEMTQILADEGCCSPSEASTYVSDFWPHRDRMPFKHFKHWVREQAQSQNHVPDEVATPSKVFQSASID